MILKELNDLYQRLIRDPQRGGQLPRRGTSVQRIGFRVTLSLSGELVGMDSLCTVKEKQKNPTPVPMLVLGGNKPSGSGLNPSFLWDNCGYMLGFSDQEKEPPEKIKKKFESFKERHLSLEKQVNHPAFSAVCRFLESWNPENTKEWLKDENLYHCNGVFYIQGSLDNVHELPEIQEWWFRKGGMEQWNKNDEETGSAEEGMSLLSGEVGPLASLHEPAIKGVKGAQMSGAKLVSFHCDSFKSYGKEQSLNAPVTESEAFAYCCALNYLLSRKESSLLIGDATLAFWADAPPQEMDEMVSQFSACLSIPNKESMAAYDDFTAKRLGELLQTLQKGKLDRDTISHGDVRFFILGLSPNASRLSIRFWADSTFGEIMESVQAHHRDMALQRQWTEENSKNPDPKLISPFSVLRQTVRDVKDMSPLLVGVYMKSIFMNLPYPDSLAIAILQRIRVGERISYIRCAALKAWLIRKARVHGHNQSHDVIKPMLDLECTQPGYLQGRLFAVYVKTQEDASDRILNATIRDNYYSAASVTPLYVMPRLARLYSQHLSKLGKKDIAKKILREKLVREIQSKINSSNIPKFLNLEQQAYFTLGYYHQMNSFYQKKESESTEEQQ